MLDVEAAVTRLESPLQAALTHASHIAAAVVDAAVSAAMVYAEPAPSHAFFVDAHRLAIRSEQLRGLEAWPNAADSLFASATPWGGAERCFRPPFLAAGASPAGSPLFGPLSALVEVVDCLCLRLTLTEDAWCLLACLRCGDQRMFQPGDSAALCRVHAPLTRLIHQGLEREFDSFARVGGHIARPSRPTTELLESLSRTERQILPHLRTAATEREIAAAVHRSPHTVHVHVKNIYRKLGISSRRDLQNLFHS